MNEIDLTTKIEGLKKAIAEHKDFTGTYESQLKETEQELKDLGKIALPPMVFDDIYEAIEKSVEEFDFDDTENFDFTNTTDLVEMIVEQVSKIFTEMDAPEDEPTAEELLAKE